MDRRVVFFFVFSFTLLATLLVAIVSVTSGQEVLNTVLYSLVTMWIAGVVSQVLAMNLYQGLVKPLEERKARTREMAARREANLEEVEEIDEVVNRLKAASQAESSAKADEDRGTLDGQTSDSEKSLPV